MTKVKFLFAEIAVYTTDSTFLGDIKTDTIKTSGKFIMKR